MGAAFFLAFRVSVSVPVFSIHSLVRSMGIREKYAKHGGGFLLFSVLCSELSKWDVSLFFS